MKSLRKCDDIVRDMIIEDLSTIGKEINELEKKLAIETSRHESITEKEIIKSLTKLADGDIINVGYRRAMIRLLVNKIFLYDDRFIVAINVGDDEVEIARELFENIEKGLDANLCLLNNSGH